MTSHNLPDIRSLLREPWLAPWGAVREYQNQMTRLWLTAFRDWPFLFPSSALVEEAGALLPQGERITDSAQPTVEPDDAMRSPPEAIRDQPQPKSRPHANKTARTRSPRQPAADNKGAKRTKRTGPAVLKGLRSRSHAVKLEAVSAMTTNKRLRTKEAIPLLQRIMENQTIRRRSPELRKAAKAVLQQSWRETVGRHPQASQKR